MGWLAGGEGEGEKRADCAKENKRDRETSRDRKREETGLEGERQRGGCVVTSASERAWEGSREGRAEGPTGPEQLVMKTCPGETPRAEPGSNSEPDTRLCRRKARALRCRAEGGVPVPSAVPSLAPGPARGGVQPSPSPSVPSPPSQAPAPRGALLTCTAEADCLLSLFPGELRPEACCSRNCRATWRACKTGRVRARPAPAEVGRRGQGGILDSRSTWREQRGGGQGQGEGPGGDE